eukprot:3477427-Amphidinium_carterae.1
MQRNERRFLYGAVFFPMLQQRTFLLVDFEVLYGAAISSCASSGKWQEAENPQADRCEARLDMRNSLKYSICNILANIKLRRWLTSTLDYQQRYQ